MDSKCMRTESVKPRGSFKMSENEDFEGSEETREDFDNDTVVKAILNVKKKKRINPPDLSHEDSITTFSFQPANSVIAVGLLSGDIALYKYTVREHTLLKQFEVHLESCRNLDFSPSGEILYSSSKDLSIALSDIDKDGQLVRIYEKVHSSPVHCLRVLNERLFASGDDQGIVKIWDIRVQGDKWQLSMKKNEEYISSMVCDCNQTYLVCGSGDGTVSTIDLRHMQFFVQTQDYDEEFTCMDLFRNDSKIVTATSAGAFYVFNWNEFGLHSDKFETGKKSVNCLVPITEDILVAGFEDGTLKAVHLFPSRDIGIVGQHDESVDHLDICSNGKFIASHSFGEPIKFWNIDYFRKANFLNRISQNKSGKKNLPSSNRERGAAFYSGLFNN